MNFQKNKLTLKQSKNYEKIIINVIVNAFRW